MVRALFPVLVLLAAAPLVAEPRSGHASHDANAPCVGCHEEIGAEWQRSLHRHAWTDRVFQSAYRVEPLAFCRSCHAPMSDAAKEPSGRAATDGIGCVTCHVGADRRIRAARPIPASERLHAVSVDAKLATVAACASCHQFDFPSHSGQLVAEPMQDTVREHARSTKADQPCQACHMRVVDGPSGKHRSHDFSVIRDPAILRRAITVAAERPAAQLLRLTLTADEVGHAFPTGDMFRRVEVRAEAVDADGRVLERAPSVVLERTFGDRPRAPDSLADVGSQRIELADTRVPPPGQGSRVVDLPFTQVRLGARLRWSVVYQRMPSPMASAFSVNQAIDEVVIATGELPITVAASWPRQGGTR